MSKDLYRIIKIPTRSDQGTLSFAEASRHIPFQIKRFYTIYNAEDGNIRGKHAHKSLEQVLFCLKGTLKIVLDTGTDRKVIVLDSPEKGLYVGNMVWREMHEFTKDSILFVVASKFYQESDYIREYDEFIKHVNKKTLVQTVVLRIEKTLASVKALFANKQLQTKE